MHFENLDNKTRKFMLEELKLDLKTSKLYISQRLNERGKEIYPDLLGKAIENGTEETLASELKLKGCFKDQELKMRNGKEFPSKMPKNAHQVLAEGEFNRYYIRALCRILIETENGKLEIYRTKIVTNPRSESQKRIGEIVDDPNILLGDLRKTDFDRALNLPSGPNSGLSVKIVYD